MPAKSLVFHGLPISRRTLQRMAANGSIRTEAIKLNGERQWRRVILRDSLEAFVGNQIRTVEV